MEQKNNSEWFAIKTPQDLRAEKELATLCDEVFLPKETVAVPGKPSRVRPIIPRVLFVRTTREHVLELERKGREHPESSVPFWIYRYPNDTRIQVIHPSSVSLMRLLSSENTAGCEIFNNANFKMNQHVRITGGQFEGYEGYVQRIKKNRHVIVKIEGICMIMLPFIHPDLLQAIP